MEQGLRWRSLGMGAQNVLAENVMTGLFSVAHARASGQCYSSPAAEAQGRRVTWYLYHTGDNHGTPVTAALPRWAVPLPSLGPRPHPRRLLASWVSVIGGAPPFAL